MAAQAAEGPLARRVEQKTYAIADWDRYFENSESRKINRLSWVPMPNRHDGGRYRRVMDHPERERIYCAWCLMVQLASRCPKRGVLADEHGPFTARRMQDKTGCPAATFELAIGVLSDPEIGWLMVVHPEVSGAAGKFPGTPGSFGLEGNRTEGKYLPPLPPDGGPEADATEYRAAVATALGVTDCAATRRKLDRWVRSAKELGATPREVEERMTRLRHRDGTAKATPEAVWLAWEKLG